MSQGFVFRSFPHLVFTQETSNQRQLFIPCDTKSLNSKHQLIHTHTHCLTDLSTFNDVSRGYWVLMCKIQLKFFQHVSISWWGAPPSLHRGNSTGHHRLLSNTQNIPSARAQNTPPAPGRRPTAAGSDVMMTAQKKGSLEVDGAAVQPPPPPLPPPPPPPPSSPLSHGSRSCEKTLITVPKGCWEHNGVGSELRRSQTRTD